MKPGYRLQSFLSLTLFCFLAIAASAQETRKKKNDQKVDVTITRNLQTHIYLLANDSMEGRRAGTPGELKTVNYLVSQYQKLAILPPAKSNSYIQTFIIDEGKSMGANTQLTINDVPLQKSIEFFPLSWSGEGSVDDISSVALQEQSTPWWLDIGDVMESNTANPHFLPEQYLKDFAKEAVKKGAKALFVYNSAGKPDSISFNRKDKSPAVDIPVIYLTPAAIKKTAINSTSSPSVKANIAFVEKKRTAHNVAAFLDNGAAQTVIIGAHLDHLGYGEDENTRYAGKDPVIHNGADDNASGTAAVIEIARLLKERTNIAYKKKHAMEYDALRKNNYLFLHFSGEELGLYGSKYFTENPLIDISTVNYMLNMDMIGRLNDSSSLTVGGVGTSPLWGEVLPTTSTSRFNIKIDSSGSGPSDHTSFYRKNIPVLFFFTGLHADYHKPEDDADKINYAGETRIIQYILDLVENSGSKGKLAFTKTKEQTMTGSKYKVSVGIMPDYTFSGAGVKADGVIDGRPAQKAGMQTGDVIIQLGDYPVTGMDTYMQALNKFEKGQTTTVTIKRGDQTKALQVTF
ncbi:MAG: M28 family peptidase [Bacteroidota bacterium]